MSKLDADTIKKIQSYPDEITHSDVWRELGICRQSVARYRRMKQEETADLLSGKEEEEAVEEIKEKLNKQDKKKLELLEHYSDKDIKEMLAFIASNKKKEIDEVIWEPWHLRFALIGDTHIGAKECALEELHRFYDHAKDEWVECVLHAGDLVDGCNVYKGQQFEQSEVWYQDQVKKVVRDYPNIWVPTYFIGWNHDESYLKSSWADITRTIDWLRDDLVNLGYYDAILNINNIKLQLQHWAGGSSYSPDYKLLRYIDTIKAWEEPDIFALWHYHRAIHSLHRWIHGFMPWAFLKRNLLAKRYKFPNIIGGWIIDITKDETGKKRLTATFINE